MILNVIISENHGANVKIGSGASVTSIDVASNDASETVDIGATVSGVTVDAGVTSGTSVTYSSRRMTNGSKSWHQVATRLHDYGFPSSAFVTSNSRQWREPLKRVLMFDIMS